MMKGLRKIAVASGKGGTGKTAITANLAISLASQGYRVVVLDADLQLANLDVALNVSPIHGLQHVVTEEKTLREVLCEAPGNIRIAAGGSALPSLMNAGPKRMATFLSQIDDLASDTDFVLFDVGAGIDSRIVTILGVAHQVVLVTTPDPSSVTDAYATVKVATKRAPATEIGLVVNRVSSVEEAGRIHEAMNTICQAYVNRAIPMLGYIHEDQDLAHATRSRQSVVLTTPGARASREIAALATSVSSGLVRPMLVAA